MKPVMSISFLKTVAIATLFIVPGAGVGPARKSTAKKPIEIYNALRIAVKALKFRRTLRDYRLTARRAKKRSTWVFVFTYLPVTPDAETIVEVRDDGAA